MRRPKRSPRLVTLCVRGRSASEPAMNKRRLALLQQSILQLAEFTNWAPLDALVLPAGYFRIRRYLGDLTHSARLKALARERSLAAVIECCATLEADHPGILIIFGMDSHAPSRAVMMGPRSRRAVRMACSPAWPPISWYVATASLSRRGAHVATARRSWP
jgi:hypothetical protein